MNDTKKCPYCGEEIKEKAKKCRYCGEWLVQKDSTIPTISTETVETAITHDIENVEIKVEKRNEKTAKELLKMMSMPSDVESLCNEGKLWQAISTLEKHQGRMSKSKYNCTLAHVFMFKMLQNDNYDDYNRVEELLNEATRSGASGEIRTSINVGRQALKKIYHDHLMPKEEREEEEIKLAMNTDKGFIEKSNYYSTFAKRFSFLDNGKDIVASADPRAIVNPHWAEVRTKHELDKSDIPLFVRYRSSTDTFAITSRGVSHFNKDKGFELQKLSWKDIEQVKHINGQVVFMPSDENYALNNLKVDDYDAVKFGDDATVNRFIDAFLSVLDELKPKKAEQKPVPTRNIVAEVTQPMQTIEMQQVAQPQIPQSSIQQPIMATKQPLIPTQEQTLSPEETSRCLAKYGLESLMNNENLKPLIPVIVEMSKMDAMMDEFVEQAGKVDEAIQEFKGQVYDAAYDIFNESTKIKNRKMQNVGMAAAGVVAIGGFAFAKWQEWKNNQRQADREEAMMEMKQKMARVKDPNIVALHEMIEKRLPQLQKLYDKELSKAYLPTDERLEKKVYAFKLTFFLYGKMLYMADLSSYFHQMLVKWKEMQTLDDMPPLQNDTLARLVAQWDNNTTVQLMRNGGNNEQWPVYSLLTISDPFILQNGVEEQLIEDVGNKTVFSSAAAKALDNNYYYQHVCSMYEKKPWSTAKFYSVSILTTIFGVLLGFDIIAVLIEKIFSITLSDAWIAILFFVVCWLAYKLFKMAKNEYFKNKETWKDELSVRFDFNLNNKK